MKIVCDPLLLSIIICHSLRVEKNNCSHYVSKASQTIKTWNDENKLNAITEGKIKLVIVIFNKLSFIRARDR